MIEEHSDFKELTEALAALEESCLRVAALIQKCARRAFASVETTTPPPGALAG
jgi:hypothetical protein